MSQGALHVLKPAFFLFCACRAWLVVPARWPLCTSQPACHHPHTPGRPEQAASSRQQPGGHC